MNFPSPAAGGAMTHVGRAMRAHPGRGIVVNPKGEILGTVTLDHQKQPAVDIVRGCSDVLEAISRAPDRPAIHGPEAERLGVSADWWRHYDDHPLPEGVTL